MSALTALDLDVMTAGGCQIPGCKCGASDGLHLSQRCHPGKGSNAIYCKGGLLLIRCAVCDRIVTQILVAKTPNEPSGKVAEFLEGKS